ncbi:hypothetical protein SACE_2769 [Saccharopolyspora erythraea NRRL 2338]|uniref:Uncharacterized protein n=1 Tax=Saccharopolyspora erythraea (strain ATCC 11635 / DSM 40517 / JCM 4748 / NBRC 13426 / NCIMB 8594 / NRRL 2338) TaxID=405948 RepID=A4FDC5_SACEN|nr:hypothetical protein N599_17870 [Saccharopolyspora erythraea D]CAM02050.1 hypothetical protein SACE_2769 [Saccharopolyspora erythraea NRRL 2338]
MRDALAHWPPTEADLHEVHGIEVEQTRAEW